MIDIRVASPENADSITQLSIQSKAYWGYDDEFMRACANELFRTEHDLACEKSLYRTAYLDEVLAGYYQLENIKRETVMLEALFVAPDKIGHGIGRALFQDAVNQARESGGKYFEVQSDPYAEPFYLSVGMLRVGETESGSIAGRYLPVLKLTLAD